MPFTRAGRQAILEIAFGSTRLSADVKYRLATNVPAGDPETRIVADFEECDFDGYAEISNPADVVIDLDGENRGRAVTPALEWVAGALVELQTAKSIYVVWSGGYLPAPELIWWEELDPWVSVANEGENIRRQITFLDRNFTL